MSGIDHVLVVDERDDAGTALVEELVHAGARITRPADVAAAVACLEEDAPSLVVVDLRMPQMKAWAFLREKSRIGAAASVPTVLLQTPATRSAAFDAHAAGVVGHVEAHEGAEAVLRFRDRTHRRATDVQLLRAWYRSDLLAELSEALGNALELDAMLERVVRLLVPSFAEWCVVRATVPEPANECHAAWLHTDATRHARLERLTLVPMSRVLESGTSELHRALGPQERTALVATEEDAQVLDEVGASALLVIPLVSRGTVLGALALGRRRGDYDTVDRELAEEAAHRIAMAVDIAAHHSMAQRAARSREDLLAIVSHDLRIPLTTISMIATKIKRSPTTSEPTRRDAETIMRNLRRMERLIRDLLDCSRLETGRLRVEVGRANVAQLVTQAVDAARPLAGRRTLRLEAPVADHGPNVLCDRERVLQVLDNLIGNALKFTPEDGTVTVRLEVHAGEVRVSVSDTGCGIAPENLPHLFEQYWQARGGDPYDARRGVGLGLFITKGLVEAQGGTVDVDSCVGEGSTFSFTLPLDDAASVPSMRGLRPIVVIDDELAFRREVMDLLKREGYDVVAFAHGRAALEYLRTSAPPGLVLMDLVMPVMDGWELASAIDNEPRLASVPIVVLSGADPARDAPRIRQCVARVQKPASPEIILRTVAEHCAWLLSGTHKVEPTAEPTHAESA